MRDARGDSGWRRRTFGTTSGDWKGKDRVDRHRWSLVLAVAASLLSSSCSTGGTDQLSTTPAVDADRGPAAPTPNPTPWLYAVDIDTGDSTRFLEPTEGGTEFAIAPGADLIAFEAEDGDGRSQIFVMRTDGTHRRQLTLEPLDARAPAWSPDGTRIAYLGRAPDKTFEINVVDVGSAESDRITGEAVDVGGTPAWSPDGETIVFQVGEHPVLRSVDIATGATETIIQNAGIPDVSPDGSKVAYNTWSMARVTFADIDGSDPTIIQTSSEAWNANWSPNGERIAFQSYPEGQVYVYELTTGETRASVFGDIVDWLDDDTLLILA